MFFVDPVAAFRNLIGALRSGGRLAMAVWATLAENEHWKIPLDIAVRRLGPPAPQPAHAPGPHAFGDRDYLKGILNAPASPISRSSRNISTSTARRRPAWPSISGCSARCSG